jgi:hypothetical protein
MNWAFSSTTKWMISVPNLVNQYVWVSRKKPIALRHKTNVELYDANYRRENGKLFMVVGSPGGSIISIANHIKCL